MRALFRITACSAVLIPLVLLVASSSFAVTITSVGNLGGNGGNTIENRDVATAADDPYCPGTVLVITGTGFVNDSNSPDPVLGAVKSVSIGNVPANWFKVGSDNTLYAQVGKGATTGPVVVTTAGGANAG